MLISQHANLITSRLDFQPCGDRGPYLAFRAGDESVGFTDKGCARVFSASGNGFIQASEFRSTGGSRHPEVGFPGKGDAVPDIRFVKPSGAVTSGRLVFFEYARCPREDLSDSVAVLPFQEGEKLVPDPVPEDGSVQIRQVFAESDPFRGEKIEEIPFRDTEQGTDDTAVFRPYSGKAFGAGATEETDEDGFRLIVLRMGGRDSVESFADPDTFEETVSEIPQGFLIAPAGIPGRIRETGKPEFQAIFMDQTLVPIRVSASETVVYVDDAEPEAELRSQGEEDMKQSDAVRSAGDRDQDRSVTGREPFAGLGIADTFDERPTTGGFRRKIIGFPAGAPRVFG